MINLFNEDSRTISHLNKKVKQILKLEDKYKSMSDTELKNQTLILKERLSKGATLDNICVDAFATAREASRRVLNQFPYPVQLLGGLAIMQGDVAEMQTGEGKTLTAVMPVYLHALEGKGVHVVTVNEYLSERDAQLMGAVYNFLGMSVGVNAKGLNAIEKRNAYACDITYTTNSELGFDYLRDNMVANQADKVMRGLHFALIDEADSILIDESRTPLIISGQGKCIKEWYILANKLTKLLSSNEYEVDVRTKTVSLTADGIAKAELIFKLDNLYSAENADLVHYISNALRARFIMQRDVDYVVDKENDEIIIVDPNTGRLMKGRQWSDGLHQAVEEKEGITVKEETKTMATITYQNFFRLYDRLSGMTGTAKTDEEEFLDIYNMKVVKIPTNRPIARIDKTDVIFGTKKAKYEAIVNEVERVHQTGQPILVGTIAVETSELISKMLSEKGIPHNTLNAKNHAQEAEIIAAAGQIGAVTIATNMAGRGTDIKLGEGVKELGGLYVLGSERHESRRIDNQLRGRSGRQGDPGVSQFYVSLEDDLMKRFGSERLEKMFASFGDETVESKTVAKSILSAQKRVEGVNYDSRKNLMQYDDVMRAQREIIYTQRDTILANADIHDSIENMYRSVIKNVVYANTLDDKVDYEGVMEGLKAYDFDKIMSLNPDEYRGMNPDGLARSLNYTAWHSYQAKIKPVHVEAKRVEKVVALQTLDRQWADHINAMDKLKTGISLRSYAQTNPIQAYSLEGYQMFQNMMNSVSSDVVAWCNRLKVTFVDPA